MVLLFYWETHSINKNMKTEVKEISNPHFQWKMKEGKVKKEILSDKIIIKKVLITYDGSGKETNREAYIIPVALVISDDLLNSLTDEQLRKIKQRMIIL